MTATGHLGNRRKLFALAALASVTVSTCAGALQSKDAGRHQDEPCRVIYNFARTFAQAKPLPAAPLALSGNFACALPKNPGLDFVIVTVPNPIETHLALWFDRAVEALQSAAGSLGYRFHEAWVPWDLDFVRAEPDISKREHQEEERSKRNKEPAVLLFRAPDRVEGGEKRPLIVLLVPETPTGGIDPDVFQDAVSIVESTTDSQEYPEILLLGPSFSGSFASLERIKHSLAQKPGIRPLWTVSGTAASADAWKAAFDASRYHTTVHDSGGLWQMLQHHLSEWEKHRRIAILSESETGYGWDNVSGNGSEKNAMRAPLIVRYPREISRLRNAYEEAELKAVVGAEQRSGFRNLLAFRFYDSAAASSDTSPVLAKNQTPLSQDSVLQEISQTLARDQINFAAILATDIFDSLFIARYLRDACPNVRLVTFDSDLLFVRGAQDFPFEGTLAVTTYPLIASNQGWTNLSQRGPDGRLKPERILFSSRAAEGTYNAMRSLLLHAHPQPGAALVEYSNPARCPARAGEDPAQVCRQPPVWLTVVSRTGYWPLAVGNPVSAGDEAARLLPWPSGNQSGGVRAPPLPRLWRLLFGLIAVSTAWHFITPLRALRRRYYKGYVARNEGQKPGFVAWSRKYASEEGWLARLCYHSIGSFALVTLYATYIAPLFALSPRAYSTGFGGYLAAAEGLLVIFILLTGTGFILSPGSKVIREKGAERWHFALLGIALLISVAYCVLVFRLNFTDLPHLEGFFFAYRSVHLSSGVSPLVPLLFLLLSYFVWAKVHLRRVGLVYDSKPWVPDLGVREPLVLDRYRKDVDCLVRDPLPWHWRTLGTWALVILIWYYLASPLQTFEYAPFDTAMILSLSMLYALLFLTWTRLLMIWQRFRLFLEGLERHPIRFAFSALPKQESWSPILQSTVAEKDSAAYFRVRDALRLLRPHASQELRTAIEVFDFDLANASEQTIAGARFFPKQDIMLVPSIQMVDEILLRELTERHWQCGHSDSQPEPAKTASPWGIAEEAIALQYATYIRYTLRQMKNLLLFVTIGFILSLTALHSYPFQAPQTITTFVTIMFLAFAGGVTTVLMQADRNAILSRITDTTPGKLGRGFYLHAAAYLGLPFVTVMGSQVPSWGRFLFSWIQPMLAALK